MAKMYPPAVLSGTKSPGETEVFYRLKSDPLTKDWYILHSLDIAEHRSQVSGEADFAIVVPARGVLCLEIKAHQSVRRKHGAWYLGSSSKPNYRGPFKQASEAMHSIRSRLLERDNSLSHVVFWSAVLFPYLDFDIEPTEWHPWQAIDRIDFESHSIGAIVLRVLDNARQHLRNCPGTKWFDPDSVAPTAQQCARIVELLRPDFEFYQSPLSRAERLRRELKQYTNEQFDALDCMHENERVLFRGPAGTGKTLLAIESARRSREEGHRVLLICYNALLGKWLEQSTQSLQPDVVAGTLHSYMLRTSGLEVPGFQTKEETRSFWERDLPEAATTILLRRDLNRFAFDELIIDEAQDLLAPSYLEFLSASLKGGLEQGRWRVFGDFERQAIYASPHLLDLHALIDKYLRDFATYDLRTNCRNTPRIAEWTHSLGRLAPPYRRIGRPDNNVEPRILFYTSAGHQSELLGQVLGELEQKGLLRGAIVLLSSKSDGQCVAARMGGRWSKRLIPIKKDPGRNQIGCCTIHAFKGLESPAVVVTDIETVSGPSAESLFYTALTRAQEHLVILAHEDVRSQLLGIMKPATSE